MFDGPVNFGVHVPQYIFFLNCHSNMDECIICCSSAPPLFKVCKCNTVIHKTCLTRMINEVESHKTECAICKTPYDTRTKIKVSLNTFYTGALAMTAFCVILPILPNILLCHTPESITCSFLHISLTVTSILSAMVFFYLCYSYKMYSGSVCPCTIRETVEISLTA